MAHFGSGVDGTVLALAGADRDLYVGGDFDEVEGVSASRFGRWTGGGMVPVRLLSFSARWEGEAVALDWETGAAWGGHAGFHVYREVAEGSASGSPRPSFPVSGPITLSICGRPAVAPAIG